MLGTILNKVEKISEDLYVIIETESVNCYLLIGNEKALLIDTGYGYEDINPIISAITDKQLLVAVTHGDPDHALGVMNFDNFMIHPLDYGKLLVNDCADVKGKMLIHRYNKMPESRCIDYDKYVNHTTVKKANPIFIENHQIIDLGNKHIEIFHTPGHSYGHVMFFERETGRLFSGDQLSTHNIWHFLSADLQAPLQMTLNSMMNLNEVSDKITGIYPAHGKYSCGMELLEDLIDCLRWELKQNYQNDIPFRHSMGNGYQHFYKTVNLIYSDERLAEFLGHKVKRHC